MSSVPSAPVRQKESAVQAIANEGREPRGIQAPYWPRVESHVHMPNNLPPPLVLPVPAAAMAKHRTIPTPNTNGPIAAAEAPPKDPKPQNPLVPKIPVPNSSPPSSRQDSDEDDDSDGIRTGRWSPEEKLLFLHGLRLFGKGHWKKIRTFLPMRSLVQIKSHAQKVLQRAESGKNIYKVLDGKNQLIASLVSRALTGITTYSKPRNEARSPMTRHAVLKRRRALRARKKAADANSRSSSFGTERQQGRIASHPTLYQPHVGSNDVAFALTSRGFPMHGRNVGHLNGQALVHPRDALRDASMKDCFASDARNGGSIAVLAAAALCELSSSERKGSVKSDAGRKIVSP